MTFKTRLTTAIATGAVLLNALAPLAIADTIELSGNGAFSDNNAGVSTSQNVVVKQTNTADVKNVVNSTASTGGNEAKFNTGGDNVIKTGNATNNVDVTNNINKNVAKVDCCNNNPVDVKISGNGAYSENDAYVNNGGSKGPEVRSNANITVDQKNDADVTNYVDAYAKTGDNEANFNTNGDNYILTGNAKTDVTIKNDVNKNVAEIGGATVKAGAVSVRILDNGAFSDNSVYLSLNKSVKVDQDNTADVDNYVDAYAKTGYNDAKFNTGGESVIKTGNADANVKVDNNVNFNAADVDCGCLLSNLTAKIDGNGSFSENDIKAFRNTELLVDQYNDLAGRQELKNDVDAYAKTGFNDVAFSTGNVYGDPGILTGNASSDTDVYNNVNSNIFTQGVNLSFPGDWNVGVSFNLAALLATLTIG